jgi:hypothetical protein
MYFPEKNTLKNNHHHNTKTNANKIIAQEVFESVVIVAFRFEIYQNNIFLFLKIIFDISTSK